MNGEQPECTVRVSNKEGSLSKAASMYKKSRMTTAQRLEDIKKFELIQLVAPEIKPIKQCHLYTKCRAFVPMEFQDEIAPMPPQEILDKFQDEEDQKKERAKQKREEAKQRKNAKRRISDPPPPPRRAAAARRSSVDSNK